MKKRLLALAIVPFLLAGCGGSEPSDSSKTSSLSTSESGGSSGQETIKYTVHFANTTMADIQIEAGKSLSKPSDPAKKDHIFVGWYSDANMTKEVIFPLVINADTTIYAKFYSYQEAFQNARENTIGNQVAGYEYDYSLQMSAGYMGLSLAGNTTGNAKYNSSSDDISFYDSHVNSGQLFIDGSKYTIKKGRDLHEISLDENEMVKKYTIKEVGDEYKYDSSSFAKAVFEYDDTKLKEIKPTGTANEYLLKTSFNASAAIALVGNYVNHPMVEKIIGQLPETSVNTGMYVTFVGDKLNSYRYEMSVDVTGIEFTLIYSMTFKNIGKAPTINPRVFNDTYISKTDIANAKQEIDSYLNAYKTLKHSSYDFLVETAVDYAEKNAINAKVDGWTKRKVSGNEVYYLNDYEIDTDLKNADLYKESGLDDCHGGRVKLSTGEVHDIKKKLIGGYSDVATVQGEEIDNYYLFDILEMIANVSFVQKITDTAKGTITYAIGADTPSAVNVLEEFNNALRINALHESTADVKAFGTFSNSSITIKNFKFHIVIANSKLSNVSLEMDGKMNTAFVGSRDFTSAQDAGFKLEYSLNVTDKGNDYEPAESVNKI